MAAFSLSVLLLGLVFSLPPSSALPTYHRVTVFGDSFAGGLYASDDAHTWRSLLLADLQAAGGAESFALLGSTGRLMVAPDAVQIATNDVSTRNPDFVLLEFGLNDVFSGTPDAEFETATRAVFEVYRGRTVVVSGIPWWGQSVGGPGDYWYERTATLDGILRRVSREFGYTFVDVFPATLNRSEYLSSPDVPSAFAPAYRGDGLHFGDAGHAALYRLYHDAITPRLWLPLLSR